MRFDDRLATVLAQPRDDAAARAVAWRQLVDLLAQPGGGGKNPRVAAARALLHDLRDGVPPAIRAAAAAAIADRRVDPAIVGLIGGDGPAIAAVLIGRVVLPDAEWIALLPLFPPPTRALLRHRRDLAPAVTRALASFGAADLLLPDPAATAGEDAPDATADDDPVEAGETQIRDLLARIAAFRGEDGAGPVAEPAPPPPLAPSPLVSPGEPAGEGFRFETGVDGCVIWVSGAPRGAVIGATIARMGVAPDHGVDGQAAGAFRQRMPFRDARLLLAGGAAFGGEWRIAGVPVFDPADGRFTGYRGTARRPRSDEQAGGDTRHSLYGSMLPADSLRQLVHELRTPLNAIVGFGEMIERQVLGPAAFPYRTRAGEIVGNGRRLLGAVDDLDTAARIASGRLDMLPDRIDPIALLHRLRQEYRPAAIARGLTVELVLDPAAGTIAADPAATERMIARLLAATIGLGGESETIAIALRRAGGGVRLILSRPAVIAGRSEAALLDPGYAPDGDWPDAPMLGLGFTLRLVRNLAVAAGGTLAIDTAAFVLTLPAATADGDALRRDPPPG